MRLMRGMISRRRFWVRMICEVGMDFNSEPNKKLPLTRPLASRGAGTGFGGRGEPKVTGGGAPRSPAKARTSLWGKWQNASQGQRLDDAEESEGGGGVSRSNLLASEFICGVGVRG